jgi:uncharacterized LabA/DUF88 family protein
MRVRVYIDGLNLFYGALQHGPHRWLDLVALARELKPKESDLDMVRYFTAAVTGESGTRQNVYLRALETLSLVSIHRGTFYHNVDRRPLSATPAPGMGAPIEGRIEGGTWKALPHPLPEGDVRVAVENHEEKGSDVNLATYLMFDALTDKIDLGIVVTGDSDLAEPIRLRNAKCGKKVEVVNPYARHHANLLRGVAHSYRALDPSILARCHLPKSMMAKNKHRIVCPDAW